MIEDMCLRNFAGTTQRSYIHYVAEFAGFFNRSPKSWIWKPSANTSFT
jgi:hypothetical protein